MLRPVERLVEDALLAAASGVEYAGRGTWRFTLANGAVTPMRARIEDEWLGLATVNPLPVAGRNALAWLEFNGTLEGLARAARAPRAHAVRLCADVSLAEPAETTATVVRACSDLHASLQRLSAEPPESFVGPVDTDACGRAAQAIGEAGWALETTPSGAIHVELDTRAGSFRAALRPAAGEALQFVVELDDLTGMRPVSQQAIAELLLALPSAVRVVAGRLVRRDDAWVAAIAATLENASAASCDRALSVLTSACQLVGREVHALRDAPLATDYLASLGWSEPQDEPTTVQEECPCPLPQQPSLISVLK